MIATTLPAVRNNYWNTKKLIISRKFVDFGFKMCADLEVIASSNILYFVFTKKIVVLTTAAKSIRGEKDKSADSNQVAPGQTAGTPTSCPPSHGDRPAGRSATNRAVTAAGCRTTRATATSAQSSATLGDKSCAGLTIIALDQTAGFLMKRIF